LHHQGLISSLIGLITKSYSGYPSKQAHAVFRPPWLRRKSKAKAHASWGWGKEIASCPCDYVIHVSLMVAALNAIGPMTTTSPKSGNACMALS
jgi:hypothetical protein